MKQLSRGRSYRSRSMVTVPSWRHSFPFLTWWLSSKISECMSSTCMLTYVGIAHCLYKFTLSYTFHALKKPKKRKLKVFSKKTKGMTCHTQPLKNAKKQGECHYPASVPSHPKILKWGAEWRQTCCSTTRVSFCNKIICLGECTTVIPTV